MSNGHKIFQYIEWFKMRWFYHVECRRYKHLIKMVLWWDKERLLLIWKYRLPDMCHFDVRIMTIFICNHKLQILVLVYRVEISHITTSLFYGYEIGTKIEQILNNIIKKVIIRIWKKNVNIIMELYEFHEYLRIRKTNLYKKVDNWGNIN